MRLLLKDCSKVNHLRFWIGDDLNVYSSQTPNCAILAIPYHLNYQTVGAIGLLSTVRMPYRQNFAILRTFSECINAALTRSIYKFKITFRQPQQDSLYLPNEERQLIGKSTLKLLEDKRFIT
jgi:heat-inducible transcriptional repressor